TDQIPILASNRARTGPTPLKYWRGNGGAAGSALPCAEESATIVGLELDEGDCLWLFVAKFVEKVLWPVNRSVIPIKPQTDAFFPTCIGSRSYWKDKPS